jgi:hypothetical protein
VCSGNALVPILAVHLLPFKFCYAVDVRPHRPLYQVRRFKYLSEVDITGSFFSEWLDGLGEDVVLTASHPCKLANEVVNLYLTHTISHLAMIPCCRGDITTKLPRLVGEWGGYMQWCFSLWMRLHEASPASDIYVDKRCQLTPCNCVVTSSQE